MGRPNGQTAGEDEPMRTLWTGDELSAEERQILARRGRVVTSVVFGGTGVVLAAGLGLGSGQDSVPSTVHLLQFIVLGCILGLWRSPWVQRNLRAVLVAVAVVLL